jgi:hypothetical protein
MRVNSLSATLQNGFVRGREYGLCPMATTMLPTIMSTTTDSWSALCAIEDSRIEARILRLSPDAWRAESTRLLRQTHPHRIASTLAFVRRMDALRAAPRVAPSPPRSEPRTTDDVDWKLWQDMVEDPAKYGDDIIEWLDLDASLRAGPKRWRVDAYWLRKEQEVVEEKKREEEAIEALRAPYKALYAKVAKQAAAKGMQRWINSDIKRFLARRHGAATKIQAAVRGYLERSTSPFLNCCMCLAHRISPLQTQVGMMCRACAEQGPYEDITGPVSDPWNWARSDFYDRSRRGQCQCNECLGIDQVKCVYCEVDCEPGITRAPGGWMCVRCSLYEEEEGMERCAGCGTYYPAGDMDSCPGYGSYCSRACGPSGYAREYNDWALD